MKLLIASACIAVIAAVGYYFWGEWQEQKALNERAADRAAAVEEIYRLAGAEVDRDRSKVVGYCERIAGLTRTTLKGNDYAVQVSRNCLILGFR